MRLLALASLAALLAGGCGRDQPQPTAPGIHVLRGRVSLTGYLVNAAGTFAGTRVVDDADGVAVELLLGNQVVGRTRTVKGVYAFGNLAAGGYVARSRVGNAIAGHTVPLVVTDTDLFAGDTLRLASVGDIYPVPNPFTSGTVLYFDLPDSEMVDVEILGMAGDTVKTLLRAPRPAGLNQVAWDGKDGRGSTSTAPLVWATVSAPGPLPDERAQLLFHSSSIPLRP